MNNPVILFNYSLFFALNNTSVTSAYFNVNNIEFAWFYLILGKFERIKN